jgi:hypothetical protein
MAIGATSPQYQSTFLRRALQLDGAFSGLSGIGLTVTAGPASSFLGLDRPWIVLVLGLILVLYGGTLLYAAAQDRLDRRFAAAVIALNIAWVVGSGLILFTPWLPLTVGGWWAVALVADAVAVFAALQYYGLRRL